eukprot:TRINITY_DN14556_c0_g2_i2.p2 TRINITY_DN14556_c0_g2~~TRINITY_DN14556_c0_g2_i2.p2  ORF type:complete len:133 (+),score=42.39 TRINITY_DN14556_c0_g2_i2:56-400(+)
MLIADSVSPSDTTWFMDKKRRIIPTALDPHERYKISWWNRKEDGRPEMIFVSNRFNFYTVLRRFLSPDGRFMITDMHAKNIRGREARAKKIWKRKKTLLDLLKEEEVQPAEGKE